MSNTKPFSNNTNDYLASIFKGAVGAVPYVGSFLSEVIGTVIPNQRIDRLANFVQELQEKLTSVPYERLNSLLSEVGFIDLLEESFVQAVRATTDERRSYIATIITSGLDEVEIAYNESKQLLKVLNELNDLEVIWLRHYWFPYSEGDEAFRELHKDVISRVYLTSGATDVERMKHALQESYLEHLERLGLLAAKFRIDRKTGNPEYDNDGKPKRTSYGISPLGRLLLKHIGLVTSLMYVD